MQIQGHAVERRIHEFMKIVWSQLVLQLCNSASILLEVNQLSALLLLIISILNSNDRAFVPSLLMVLDLMLRPTLICTSEDR